MGISILLQIGMVKLLETLHSFKCQNVSVSNYNVYILLILIYIFIQI